MGGYPTPWYGAPAAAGEEVAPILGLAEPLSSVREVCGAARGIDIDFKKLSDLTRTPTRLPSTSLVRMYLKPDRHVLSSENST